MSELQKKLDLIEEGKKNEEENLGERHEQKF